MYCLLFYFEIVNYKGTNTLFMLNIFYLQNLKPESLLEPRRLVERMFFALKLQLIFGINLFCQTLLVKIGFSRF